MNDIVFTEQPHLLLSPSPPLPSPPLSPYQSRSFVVLVAAMNTFPQDERVLLGGCTAIMNVAGPRGGGRGKAARKAGATDAVKMACGYVSYRTVP